MIKRLRIPFLILVLLLALCCACITAQAQTYIIDADFKFTFDENEYITIYGYEGTDTEITVPEYLIGFSVPAIGDYAFLNETTLTSITLPTSLTTIGKGAFYGCTSLQDIEFPANCTSLGAHLLYGCTSLKSVTLSPDTKSLPRYCFSRCSALESVYVPTSCTAIGDCAFQLCTSLRSVYIQPTTVTISDKAFLDTPDVVIYGYLGSYAQTYAARMGIAFSALDEVQTHFVTFYNYDGSINYVATVADAEAAELPADPVRPSDANYDYTFSAWDTDTSCVTADMEVYPVFDRTEAQRPQVTYYTVVFVDADGTFIDAQVVAQGEAATAPAAPAKAADAQYTYTFTGWDTAFTAVAENLTVRAEYSTVVNTYEVTFVDYNGDELKAAQTVAYGSAATAPADPTREGYTFTGWDKAFDSITADTTVTATYSENAAPTVYYTVVFLNADGGFLGVQTVAQGADATAPATPTKAADAQNTYAFAGWDKTFSAVTENLTVTATYTATAKEYTVTFKGYDGATITTDTVAYGEAATAPSAPVRSGYTFKAWDKSFDNVTEDITVTATYTRNAPAPATTGTLKIEVTGGTGFTISVDGGAARAQGASYMNTKMPKNVSVTLVAQAIEGSSFIGWINTVNGVVVSTSETFTFVAGGNDSYKAMYNTDVTGVNLVVFMNDKFSQIKDMQYYAAGDEITVPEAPSATGYDFAGWSMTVAQIQAKLAAGEDVTVIGTWTVRQVYVTVNVVNGSITSHGTMQDGKYLAAREMIVVADTVSGKNFWYWVDQNGKIKSYDSTYSFYPADDTTLTAVYADEGTPVTKQVLANVDAADLSVDPAKINFYISWYVPEAENNLRCDSSGILAVDSKNYNEETFVIDAGLPDIVFQRSPGAPSASGTYTWTKSRLNPGDVWYAKAFVRYTDLTTGEQYVVYSDMFEVTRY